MTYFHAVMKAPAKHINDFNFYQGSYHPLCSEVNNTGITRVFLIGQAATWKTKMRKIYKNKEGGNVHKWWKH